MKRIKVIVWIFFLISIIGIMNYVCNISIVKKNMDFTNIFDSKDDNNTFDNISISKSYEGRLGKNRRKRIISNMVNKIDGEIIDIENVSNKYGVYSKKEMLRLYGYSRKLTNNRQYMGNKINFSIVVTYNKNDNRTNIYFGSPIVNIDYWRNKKDELIIKLQMTM